jgi:hypothetical protein
MSNFNHSLNDMKTSDLLQRLENYKKVDLQRISDEELSSLTSETIPSFSLLTVRFSEGTKLYRVRSKKPGQLYTSKSDVWYPPPEYVTKRQRLNEAGESILYTSLDRVTPFHEVRAKANQYFAHFEYEIVKGADICVTSIGLNHKHPEGFLDKQGEINSQIIDQFLFTEFTKDVGVGTEYLYRISVMIAKNFFDGPDSVGYMFPSVAFNKGTNLALKPIARNKLKLNKVTNVKVKELEELGGIHIDIESVSKSIQSDGTIIY